MININGKHWEELEIDDIYELLKNTKKDETFFFEYKNDDVSTKKLLKEISAFANTYGGYILLGIEDDKRITGCKNWNEQKIHNTIYNGITPIPNFDVQKLENENDNIIYVIKIEEGVLPPYITNRGMIFERVSSGSFLINKSSKLMQLYYKNDNQLKKIKNKIEIEKIKNDFNIPDNLCGYLDLGFSLSLNNIDEFQKRFYNLDLEYISQLIKKKNLCYSISKVGYSLVISIGKSEMQKNNKTILCNAGLNNYIEIMCDGSIKCRTILFADEDNNTVNILPLFFLVSDFQEIYKYIVGENFSKYFISAHKYEKLTVLKQFVPSFKFDKTDEMRQFYDDYLNNHKNKYGNNLIISSNRIPKNGFINLDKKYFSEMGIDFNDKNIIRELFDTRHLVLGFIDEFPELEN